MPFICDILCSMLTFHRDGSLLNGRHTTTSEGTFPLQTQSKLWSQEPHGTYNNGKFDNKTLYNKQTAYSHTLLPNPNKFTWRKYSDGRLFSAASSERSPGPSNQGFNDEEGSSAENEMKKNVLYCPLLQKRSTWRNREIRYFEARPSS